MVLLGNIGLCTGSILFLKHCSPEVFYFLYINNLGYKKTVMICLLEGTVDMGNNYRFKKVEQEKRGQTCWKIHCAWP